MNKLLIKRMNYLCTNPKESIRTIIATQLELELIQNQLYIYIIASKN